MIECLNAEMILRWDSFEIIPAAERRSISSRESGSISGSFSFSFIPQNMSGMAKSVTSKKVGQTSTEVVFLLRNYKED